MGSGSVWPATLAAAAPAGSVASHTETGKSDALESAAALAVVRSAIVPAPTRSAMRCCTPSTVSSGQREFEGNALPAAEVGAA